MEPGAGCSRFFHLRAGSTRTNACGLHYGQRIALPSQDVNLETKFRNRVGVLLRILARQAGESRPERGFDPGGTANLAVLGGNLPPSGTHRPRPKSHAGIVRSTAGRVARQNGPVARSTRNTHHAPGRLRPDGACNRASAGDSMPPVIRNSCPCVRSETAVEEPRDDWPLAREGFAFQGVSSAFLNSRPNAGRSARLRGKANLSAGGLVGRVAPRAPWNRRRRCAGRSTWPAGVLFGHAFRGDWSGRTFLLSSPRLVFARHPPDGSWFVHRALSSAS
jgi:hypothetical protein